MTELTYPRLTITGDVDGDGVDEEGIFEMKSADLTPGIRTGSLFTDGDGLVQSARSIALGSRREDVRIDGGGGTAFYTIQFNGWEGESGKYQWGDSPDVKKRGTSATGQAAISQISVLFKYLLDVDIDSRNPAQLEWGEFSDQGMYQPIDVAIEEPEMTRSRDEASSFEGTITCIKILDDEEIRDARVRFNRFVDNATE